MTNFRLGRLHQEAVTSCETNASDEARQKSAYVALIRADRNEINAFRLGVVQ